MAAAAAAAVALTSTAVVTAAAAAAAATPTAVTAMAHITIAGLAAQTLDTFIAVAINLPWFSSSWCPWPFFSSTTALGGPVLVWCPLQIRR